MVLKGGGMNKLLLTGASGAMATLIRPYLAKLVKSVVLSSLEPVANLAAHEEWRHADLANYDELKLAVKGCDAILHLGGYSVEGPFDTIYEANIKGVYNLYEAARAEGHPRILFASSNHVTGYYPPNVRLKGDVLHRPDSLYGVSKSFGESLARFYFEKYGQETAIVRIGSFLDKPTNQRGLSTWLSVGDFVRLLERVFTVPVLACPIVYGVSDNKRSWWDNSDVAYLGWTPQDNAEDFADDVEAPDPNPNAPMNRYQGGNFIVPTNNAEN
tara:strand:+ start:5662 stop:6474 length:813 start_codon:yes stop_codon:yes gene_type:complete